MTLTLIISILLAGAAGLGLGKFVFAVKAGREKEEAEKEAKRILFEAESKAEAFRKEKELQAKERFIQLKSEHEAEVQRKNQSIQSREQGLTTKEQQHKQKEQTLNQKLEQASRKENELDQRKQQLDRLSQNLEQQEQELSKAHMRTVQALEKVAGLSAEQARQQLMESLMDEARSRASASIKDLVDEAKLNAHKQAKKVVIETIQRSATEHSIENSISVFQIKNDEIKGQIIGREGRNIRALEAATGVEFLVDDTPEAIILSCFDPLRREIARLAHHDLLNFGAVGCFELLDEIGRQFIGFTTGSAIADGDQINTMLLAQFVQSMQRAIPITARLVGINRSSLYQFARVINNSNLNASANAWV